MDYPSYVLDPLDSVLRRIPWTTEKLDTQLSCNFAGTDICDCPNLYPDECTTMCSVAPEDTPTMPVPTTPNINPTTPNQAPTAGPQQTPPTAGPPPNPPVAKTCSGSAPSALFSCVNGQWVAYGSVTVDQFIVPASVGPIRIQGNLTTSVLSFNRLTASQTLTVSGCINGLKDVDVEINQENMDNLGNKEKDITLVKSENPSCTDLTATNFKSKVVDKSKGCRDVKTKKSSNSGKATLAGAFKVDMGKCNTWWIILLCVAVVVIVVIVVIVLVVIFVKPVKVAFMPFYGANN